MKMGAQDIRLSRRDALKGAGALVIGMYLPIAATSDGRQTSTRAPAASSGVVSK